ncbi:L-rhamnose mutarotase [Nocardioides sp. Leaf285]|uniref:L-rhamnose mutarotase n=1 Tax=Nocardioides sp. Leaf285 TaxID=1736322 RepID=UPI0009E85452|nr:L-rhamnose mutarotase [Nocardioides sp. Leaf285]
MQRVCFQLQVRPDRIDEYRRRHAAVWPEMCRALHETGWHNYSLFLREDGLLIGYLETPDLAAAQAGMAATEVNARWQAEMGELFVDLEGLAPDEGFLVLEEVFHLEDQLPDQLPDQLQGQPPATATARTPGPTPTTTPHTPEGS